MKRNIFLLVFSLFLATSVVTVSAGTYGFGKDGEISVYSWLSITHYYYLSAEEAEKEYGKVREFEVLFLMNKGTVEEKTVILKKIAGHSVFLNYSPGEELFGDFNFQSGYAPRGCARRTERCIEIEIVIPGSSSISDKVVADIQSLMNSLPTIFLHLQKSKVYHLLVCSGIPCDNGKCFTRIGNFVLIGFPVVGQPLEKVLSNL